MRADITYSKQKHSMEKIDVAAMELAASKNTRHTQCAIANVKRSVCGHVSVFACKPSKTN